MLGVDVIDLDLGVRINSIKQPIKCNSVSPGNMSHCRTSPFNDHLDHNFVVLKHIQHSTGIRMRCIRWNVINVCWNNVGVLDWDGVMHVWLDNCRRVSQWLSLGSICFGRYGINTSITKYQRVRA